MHSASTCSFNGWFFLEGGGGWVGSLLYNLVHRDVQMFRSVTEKCARAAQNGALYISQLPGVVIRLHWLRLQQKAFRSVTKSRETEQREGARALSLG